MTGGRRRDAGESRRPLSPGLSWRGKPLPVGLLTPVVTMLPAAHASWEEDGTMADIAAIASAADRLHYDHLTCSEHVVVPTDVAQMRGSRYWDPLATFGYLAAVTDAHPTRHRCARARLPPSSGYRQAVRDPGSGVGRSTDPRSRVGSLAEEFELLGAPFDDRGARPTTPSPRSGRLCQSVCRPTTARTTATGRSSSTRAPVPASPCGSVVGRAGHFAAPSDWPTDGVHSGCAPPRLPRACRRPGHTGVGVARAAPGGGVAERPPLRSDRRPRRRGSRRRSAGGGRGHGPPAPPGPSFGGPLHRAARGVCPPTEESSTDPQRTMDGTRTADATDTAGTP